MSTDTNIETTFCFVDIAGYTALTEAHGEGAAADLFEDFSGLIREGVEGSGRMHELTGDSSFLVFPDPIAAISGLSTLYKSIADRPNFPIVRAGLHHGQALFRGNRYFGSTVNVAARVAAQAIGGQILCTKSVAETLIPARISGVEVAHQGPVSLRNIPEPVDVYEVILSGVSRDYAIDPVCKMQVNKRAAPGSLYFGNNRYWFCSLSCVELFARQPLSYV
jgi:adenylate cyclase